MQQYLVEKTELPLRIKKIYLICFSVFICVTLYFILTKNSSLPKEYTRILVVESLTEEVKVKGIGSIIPQNTLLISAPDNGHILNLNIRLGQVVKKGQLLTKIKNYELEQNLQDAQYHLINLRSEVVLKESDLEIRKNQLEIEFSRIKNTMNKYTLELNANNELVTKGVVSKIQFEQSKMNYEQAKLDVISGEYQLALFNESFQQQIDALNSKVKASIKRLEFLQTRIANLTINAEISGIIKEMSFNEGQVVKQGQNLFEIIDNTKLQAKIQIPQYSSAHLSINQKAEIITPNGKLKSRIEHIDSVIRKGSISVYLSFSNNIPDWIRVDQSVEALISTDKSREKMFIDKPSSFEEYKKWFFYRIDKEGNATKLLTDFILGENDNILIQGNVRKKDKLMMIPEVYANKKIFNAGELSI